MAWTGTTFLGLLVYLFLKCPTPPTAPGLTNGYPTTLNCNIFGIIDCKFSHVDSKGLKNRKAGALGLLKELATEKRNFFNIYENQLFENMHRICKF